MGDIGIIEATGVDLEEIDGRNRVWTKAMDGRRSAWISYLSTEHWKFCHR
jgi:hypothetical protein